MGQIMKNKPKLLRDVADRVIKNLGRGLTMTKTVRELLFDGYDDRLLAMAKKFNISIIPFTKFGWFYQVCTL